jgi:hypothetical protein
MHAIFVRNAAMRLALLPLLLCIGLVPPAAGAEPTTPSVQAAVRRALPWLARDMVAWRENNQCAACHHGPMYLWSSHVAKRQGYAVDERQLESYTEWLINDPSSRIFPASQFAPVAAAAPSAADRMTTAMMGRRNLSQPTLYLAHALNSMPAGNPLAAQGQKRLAEHWRAAQMDDGSLAGRAGRPPIFNTPHILTLWAAAALHDLKESAAGAPALALIRRRADDFLTNQSPDTSHQAVVLQLLLATSRRDPRQQALFGKVRSSQRDDGGWSQSPDRPSDAFATGQTLHAMNRAGVPPTDESVRRGLRYLATRQAADGTWPMTSRIDPSTDKPADDLNPITYAATAWAVIGMSSYVPNDR